MADWRETTLGEVCDEVGGIIQTGPFGSQLHESDYSPEGIPVVMPKDIIEGRIATDSVARVSPEHAERLARHKLRSGDIVYGRRGDIGRQALITPEQEGWMCGTGCLRLSFGESVLNPLFLHYYLRQDDVISWITNQAVGATMPNLNTGILRTVPVRFPPLPVQRRIAGVLSAYDELIENSQRRIKILEAMARALYREWFVHFRFPGHENHPRVASPLGEIPEGWIVELLSSFCEVTDYVANGSFASLKANVTYRNEPDYAVLMRGTDFNSGWNGKYVYVTEHSYRFLKKSELRPGDIVVTNVGNVGTAFLVPDLGRPMTLGPNSVLARPREGAKFFFHYLCSEEGQHRIRSITSGVAQPKFNKTEFRSLPLVVPTDSVLREFERVVAPIHVLAESFRCRIQNLRRTRDLLLPRLLSGQVEIKMEAA